MNTQKDEDVLRVLDDCSDEQLFSLSIVYGQLCGYSQVLDPEKGDLYFTFPTEEAPTPDDALDRYFAVFDERDGFVKAVRDEFIDWVDGHYNTHEECLAFMMEILLGWNAYLDSVIKTIEQSNKTVIIHKEQKLIV